MEVYEKSVASIASADDEKFGKNGGFTAVLTNESLDRDGESLDMPGWLPFQDRYPLDFDHEMSVAGTIGSYHPYQVGDEIWMDAYFSSIAKAQEVRTLVNEGHIKNVSVAFMTDRSKKSGPRREMLNAGIVAIPSNRDAVIMASKAASLLKDRIEEGVMTPNEVRDLMGIDEIVEQVEDKTPDEEAETKAPGTGGGGDRAMLQAAHDAIVHLAGGPGNLCIQLVTDEDPTGADDGANKSKADEVETKTPERRIVTVRKSFEDNSVTLIYGDREEVFTEEQVHDGAASNWLSSLIEPVDSDKSSENEPEDFEKALDEALTTPTDSEESPADTEEPAPAAEAAAASDEDAADDADEELAVEVDALRLQLQLLA